MIRQFESPITLIQPEFVHRIKVVVANIDIRKLIVVEIPHRHAQPPVERGLG